MSDPFICEKCGNTTYEQMTYTQARCLQCGYLNLHDSGFKGQREFQLSPEEDLLNIENKKIIENAPMIKRAVNYLIDILFISFIFVIISSFAGVDITSYETTILQVSMLIALTFYYIIMEYFFGKTIGKYFTKTKVINADGNKISFKQSLIRAVCRWIPFESLSGLIMQGKFWHDSIAKTYVVEE